MFYCDSASASAFVKCINRPLLPHHTGNIACGSDVLLRVGNHGGIPEPCPEKLIACAFSRQQIQMSCTLTSMKSLAEETADKKLPAGK